ncbi:MAG TPA: sigma-70 family RNA polymerase sigma factor [Verrucomicrobiota bacterium]|jgi:RNA polymerase sigma-70 factor (ECF subfamily)|nr:sigma-70 family RNA polymerase sigma factor [Verrucomicrobiota bacterium]HQL77586.1 sigma-70 family RNA polymerase sigma factor [Verrucomicrobiota bacterium]
MLPQQEQSAPSLSRDWFTTTHWSVVLAARQPDTPGAQQALERLCRTYWYPLYVFIRHQGCSPEDAQDLTQAFFERVLARNYFDQADREKGRFRAFLLARLKHFMSDQRDRDRAAKRGGGATVLSLDAQTAEERYRLEPLDRMAPDRLYERRWAFTVLAQARERLWQEFLDGGKGELYQQLNALETGEERDHTYAEVGRRLGMSEDAIKSAVVRLRRRYGELLRQEIAQTVATASEIDQEIRHLMAAIAD